MAAPRGCPKGYAIGAPARRGARRGRPPRRPGRRGPRRRRAGLGLRLPLGGAREVARRDERAGHRLGGGGPVPVLDALAARIEDRVRATRVVDGLGCVPEDAVDPGEHPVAARLVGGVADLAPVPGARVRGVDQLGVVAGRAVLALEQVPGAVEQPGREGAVDLGVEGGGRGRGGHGDVLGFGWGGVDGCAPAGPLVGGQREHVEAVERPLEPRGPGLEAHALLAQDRRPCRRLVGPEERPDRGQAELQVPERRDRASHLQLVASIAAIPGGRVHVGRHEDALLVVVTEGADRQPGLAGEPADGEELVVHGRILNPRVTRESSPKVGGRPTRCRARGRWPAG